MNEHNKVSGHNESKDPKRQRYGHPIARIWTFIVGTGGLAALIGVYVAAAAAGHWFPFESHPTIPPTSPAPKSSSPSPKPTQSDVPLNPTKLNSALLVPNDLGNVVVPPDPVVSFCSYYPQPTTISTISNYEWDPGSTVSGFEVNWAGSYPDVAAATSAMGNIPSLLPQCNAGLVSYSLSPITGNTFCDQSYQGAAYNVDYNGTSTDFYLGLIRCKATVEFFKLQLNPGNSNLQTFQELLQKAAAKLSAAMA